MSAGYIFLDKKSFFFFFVGTVIPMEFITYPSDIPHEMLFSPLTSIISIVILVIILTSVCITVCYFRRKSEHTYFKIIIKKILLEYFLENITYNDSLWNILGFHDLNDDVCDSMSITTQNQRNRDQQYGIKSSRSQQTLSADPASCKTDSTGKSRLCLLEWWWFSNSFFWKNSVGS